MDKELLTIPDFLRNQKNLAAEKKQQAETSPDGGQSRSTGGLGIIFKSVGFAALALVMLMVGLVFLEVETVRSLKAMLGLAAIYISFHYWEKAWAWW